MIKDLKENILIPIQLHSKTDTFMASICLLLYGTESLNKRKLLRNNLLSVFKKYLYEDDCYNYSCIRTFVKRLHYINSDKYPESAEQLYVQDKSLLIKEGEKFLQKSETVSYIFDRFTFAYLVAEYCNVNVHIFEPELISLYKDWLVIDGYYDIYIQYDVSNLCFKPLKPKILRIPFMPHLTLQKISNNSIYFLQNKHETICRILAPQVRGYRVHSKTFTSKKGPYIVDAMYDKPTFIYLKIEDECFKLISYGDKQTKSKPTFLVGQDDATCTIAVVVAQNEEEANQSIKMEQYAFF